jgi:hypothetical protein
MAVPRRGPRELHVPQSLAGLVSELGRWSRTAYAEIPPAWSANSPRGAHDWRSCWPPWPPGPNKTSP